MAAPSRSKRADALLGLEAKLWQMADKLRHNLDAAAYKHVVLGLFFLKHLSDAAEEPSWGQTRFLVPEQARFARLVEKAEQPEIGRVLDDAIAAIEHANPTLSGVLPAKYSALTLPPDRLGGLVKLLGTLPPFGEESRSRDVLGRVYEYFLTQFAEAEGKHGGQFYTPPSVVRLLVEMLAPHQGSVLDPCCGSGGMFVQSERFVQAQGGPSSALHIYGQESSATTYQLAKQNLAIRGMDATLAHGDSLLADAFPSLKADYILANPPFNDSDWAGERLRSDPRWQYGVPPLGNANFAWVQHFLYHLGPNGIAGFVLTNGSMSSHQSSEGAIRGAIVEADLVDCMVALPEKLFYSTQIPVCLWIVAKNKAGGIGKRGRALRDRRRETLFVDAQKLGSRVDRAHRQLSQEDIGRIADTYHCFRGDGDGAYEDVAGFCKCVRTEEIAAQGHVLTPLRYVGTDEKTQEMEPFEARMERLVAELEQQFDKGARLEKEIRAHLRGLGYGR